MAWNRVRAETDGNSRRRALKSFGSRSDDGLWAASRRRIRPPENAPDHHDPRAPTMNSAIKMKLSVMMFLEYVIYGAWLPLLGNYIGEDFLNFTPGQQGWVFNAFA